jgi:hypothetical protein
MLLIVPVRLQDSRVSRCMGLGSVSWDISITAGIRLLVVLLVVVWPVDVVSDMPIYDDFLDVYVFCMLHVSYIELSLSQVNFIYHVLKVANLRTVDRPAGGCPPEKKPLAAS